ncbi:MAG: hypothetical protein ACI9JM_003136 [Halioglobus sp.]|jgi:hypothetical protein
MITKIRNMISPLRALHQDERGDNENLGRLLLLALVLIPLILLIAIFGGEIYEEAQTQWDAVMDTSIE